MGPSRAFEPGNTEGRSGNKEERGCIDTKGEVSLPMMSNTKASLVAGTLTTRPAASLLPLLLEMLMEDEVTEDLLVLWEEIRLLTEGTSPGTLETRLESEEVLPQRSA